MIPRLIAAILHLGLWIALASSQAAIAQEDLFKSRRLTQNEYPRGIEGPAVDVHGNLYVVNFERPGTIGRLAPGGGRSELFATLPAGSIGNGIRFDDTGRMFVADYRRHTIFIFERGETNPQIYFRSEDFSQPNDLAVARDGALYASDPTFSARTGRIWRIERGADGKGVGTVVTGPRTMGVTNGLDLSPDGQTLYVSESDTCEVWAYRIDGGSLAAPRLVKRFEKSKTSELDGLRTDIDGAIYVTRPGDGTIAIVEPDGRLRREVRLLAKSPTNLSFGGPDGRTVYVTQADGGYIESFRVDRPGREFCQRSPGLC